MANQEQPPMTLRVNQRHGSVAAYRQRLVEAGILPADGATAAQTAETREPAAPSEPVNAVLQASPQPLLLPHGVPVGRLPGFAQGDVSVQDAAAQIAAPL